MPHVPCRGPGGVPAPARRPPSVSPQGCETRFKGKGQFSSGRATLGLNWSDSSYPSDTREWRLSPGFSSYRWAQPRPPARVILLLALTQQGVWSWTSGKFPDECSVLVSKIKQKFFSEENLYGLWNLGITKRQNSLRLYTSKWKRPKPSTIKSCSDIHHIRPKDGRALRQAAGGPEGSRLPGPRWAPKGIICWIPKTSYNSVWRAACQALGVRRKGQGFATSVEITKWRMKQTIGSPSTAVVWFYPGRAGNVLAVTLNTLKKISCGWWCSFKSLYQVLACGIYHLITVSWCPGLGLTLKIPSSKKGIQGLQEKIDLFGKQPLIMCNEKMY